MPRVHSQETYLFTNRQRKDGIAKNAKYSFNNKDNQKFINMLGLFWKEDITYFVFYKVIYIPCIMFSWKEKLNLTALKCLMNTT
jgi:hypothetical protein